jgi:hypothetical protein
MTDDIDAIEDDIPRGVRVLTDGNSVIRVALIGDTLHGPIAPLCGSCPWLLENKCRVEGAIRPGRVPKDYGCREHPFASAYERLADAARRLGRGLRASGNEILSEFSAASPADIAWLENAEQGFIADSPAPIGVAGPRESVLSSPEILITPESGQSLTAIWSL